MAYTTMPKGSAVKFGGTFVTEHNRQPIEVSVERIESADRMANGTLRKYVIADKRTWNISWNDLPGPTAKTVDNQWGADAIETFYNTTKGAFTMIITANTGGGTFTVMFTDFSKTLNKRGVYDLYDLNLTVTEV